jgi:hypothetical protein
VLIDIKSVQFELNGVPKINNMLFSVSGGTPGSTVPVTITADNQAGGPPITIGTFNVTLDNQGNNNGFNTGNIPLGIPQGTYDFTASSPGFTPDTIDSNQQFCFIAGTLIRTGNGDVAVEDLAIGDLVRTADGRDVPVMFIGRQAVHTRFAPAGRAMPIRIRAGALGENTPSRDLHVSPHHAIVVDGALCHAQALVNGTTIAPVAAPTEVFTYYSIELPGHEVIIAEGATVESFADNVPRALFDNAAEFDALYPQGREVGEMSLPRAMSARQVPASIRARIQDRAAVILGVADKAA